MKGRLVRKHISKIEISILRVEDVIYFNFLELTINSYKEKENNKH